ncbi:MAG: DNA ligase D [Bradyrhizobiaceae bacterium]|nr:DNA ligase D [Bradyrhizobiaceae bacterium]
MLRESDRLKEYRAKRDFSRTPEPAPARRRRTGRKPRYLIQKHAARRLHFDFRLEHDGALLSWAVPKGPSYDPKDKRLAVRVEDHPLEYGKFEGTIPAGEYGGGTVMLWDTGTWEPLVDVDEGLRKGQLKFALRGKRLKGSWALIRLRGSKRDKGKENWLLVKERDPYAKEEKRPIVERETRSAKSGRTMQQIAQGRRVWHAKKETRDQTSEAPAAEIRQKKDEPPARLPGFVSPQLAILVDAPPLGENWLHEIKFDGYRAITSIANGKVAIRTRKGLNWTDRFRALVPALADLPCNSALLDGEIAVTDPKGHTNFGALQEALSNGTGGYGYYLFDILSLDGRDLRRDPLIERKKALGELLEHAGDRGFLFYSDHIIGAGERAYAQACDMKLEGLISKRIDAPYRPGRTGSWLKSKCGMEQEFVIVGWRPSDKRGRPFSSLLLAVNKDGGLRYAGRVGSGYSETRLDQVSAQLHKHARKNAPVKGIPASIARQAKFVEPVLVAEIAFRGWTHDGLVRQGSFKGLRADKPARAIVRERPMPKAAAVNLESNGEDEIAGVHITNPDRVLYADQGITKRELIEHYLKVAKWMLPHVKDRPLALVRCPRGSGKECFFQKHASPGWPGAFRKIRIREKSGSDEYLYIEDESGLVAAAQMGVLELHLWGSRVDDVEKPDRLVFDLDPDEDIPFERVKGAARDMRKRLQRLGLKSFPMATGGKGIHVVVPLVRGHSWDDHRNFAEAVARLMAEEEPERFTAVMSKARRRGKIFVDYLRNQRGSTAIAPYSSRAKKGAAIALPLSWPQLARLKNAQPMRIGEFLRTKSDPWAGYFSVRQRVPGHSITAA